MFTPNISTPNIHLQENTLISDTYNDIYFSKKGGEDESRFVFIEGNRLRERWKAGAHQHHFTIGEMGFGTGLNFLTTWQYWENIPDDEKPKKLIFISVESSPLGQEDLEKISMLFSEHLKKKAQKMIANYPPLVGGFYTIDMARDVRLMLLWGEAKTMWQEVVGSVNAFYLDGFSPAKNPDMWSQPLLQVIAAHSIKNETTVSSFSAAGHWRKHLAEVGFEVKKQKGFAQKREMTTAIFRDDTTAKSQKEQHISNSYLSLSTLANDNPIVGIIGAGLAGIWTAKQMKARGFDVRIWDEHGIGTKASSNPVGLVSPYFNRTYSPLVSFLLSSFYYTKHKLKNEFPSLCHFEKMIQVSKNETQLKRLQSLSQGSYFPSTWLTAITQNEFEQLTHITSLREAFVIQEGFYTHPKELCTQIAEQENLHIISEKILNIQFQQNQWHLHTQHQIAEVDVLIIANGNGVLEFKHQLSLDDLRISQGFYGYLPSPSPSLMMPLKCGSTLCPLPSSHTLFWTGTYLPGKSLEESALEWVEKLKQVFPNFNTTHPEMLSSINACDRLTTSDRSLILGRAYSKSQEHSPHPKETYIPHQNLILNIGHGARGLMTTPLTADIAAGMLSGEPLPLARTSLEHLGVERFLKRAFKKWDKHQK